MKRVVLGRKRALILPAERQDFTRDRVQELLGDSIKDKNTRVRALSDTSLSQLTRELQALRTMVIIKQSERFQNSLEHRARLAEGLRLLKSCLPPLIQECKRSQGYAAEDGKDHAVPLFEAGEEVLRPLAIAAYATESFGLFAEVRDEPREVRWEQYADQIIGTLQQLLPTLQKEALHRFLASAFRDITGEILTPGAVSRVLERNNVVKWRNLPT